MEKSGLYACIAFDGAPMLAHDAAALGLDPAGDSAVRGRDRAMPHCVDVAHTGDSICVLVGRIDDDDGALADGLGLTRDAPAAVKARAALDRFGDDVAAHVPGEWSCLLWDGDARRLQLAMSRAKRDPIYYQLAGSRIAVAPDIASFRRLGWAAGAIDEEALLFALSRPALYRGIGNRTIMRDVHAVPDGSVVTIDSGGRVRTGTRPGLSALDWTGTVDAAVAEVDRLMRAEMRRRLAGHDRVMCLISGGLDSSTIAWLAAAERAPGQSLTLLSSVAAPGSGVQDERAFSEIVAKHLDLPIVWVTPGADVPVYRPSQSALSRADGPMFGPRHYLYDAFHDAALADGASLLLDGAVGEMTVTGHYPMADLRSRLRRTVKGLLRRDHALVPPDWPAAAFLPRIARHRLVALPERMRAIWQSPQPLSSRRRARDDWGFMPGSDKMMRMSTETVNGRLRNDYPFRDAALLCRFAGFPIAYTRHGGLDRAFARMLMTGHLPDAIRLRPKGTAFSPDYDDRLRRQAAGQSARIALLRKARIDDWLDLDWLDDALRRIAVGGTHAVSDPMQVQTTALVAEYLYWWFEG